jgi:hypothetical protein
MMSAPADLHAFHRGRRLNVLHRLALSYKEQTQGSIAFRTFVKDCSVLHIFSGILIPGSTDSAVLKQIITVCYIHKYSPSPSVSPTETGAHPLIFSRYCERQDGREGGGGGGGGSRFILPVFTRENCSAFFNDVHMAHAS